MHDVGIELLEVTANACRQRKREAIFGSAGDWDGGYVDEVASGREGGMFDRRRVNANLHPLAQQVADEAIERLIGAVAHVIVIAREEGHAEVAGLHGGGL